MFDLHALQLVPGSILRLDPDDPEALRWLWAHRGTTWTLRRVEQVSDEAECFAVHFFSADWTPCKRPERPPAAMRRPEPVAAPAKFASTAIRES